MADVVRSYRDLKVWQQAMELVVDVYQATDPLPERERFGLQSQARRAAVSIPSNLAEGYCRRQKRDYRRFVNMARGSLGELETQLILCVRLDMLNKDSITPI